MNTANAGPIAALCRALDGLPLALELAAARLAIFSPEALLNQMADRLAMLSDGPRDAPPRQQTIEAAIGWSHDLLSPDEQAMFRRLAVCAGGFTLEAAEAIGSWLSAISHQHEVSAVLPIAPTPRHPTPVAHHPSPSIVHFVSRLLDQSLIQRLPGGGEPRFFMLETIRAFGLERLTATGEHASARDAHRAWRLDTVERASPYTHGPGAAAWLDKLQPEHDNIRAALAWSVTQHDGEAALRLCVGLLDFWRLRGHVLEGRDWLEASLAIGADARAIHRARALHGRGEMRTGWATRLARWPPSRKV